ncbi:MAG TPA: MMPL family transporter, partial [Solirubrobacterales bacterium]|nr:MMPL family transporter [Solirubrobacterales bacterium]
MTGPLYAIGRFCSRHHYPVIAAWVALAIALLAIGHASGSKTSENLTLPGTDSTTATELLEDDLPEQAYGSNPLVLEAPNGKLTDPKYAQPVAETVKRLNALHDVNSAVSPLSPQGAAFLSKDQSVGYVPVVLSVGPGEIDETQAQRILDSAEPAKAAGLETAVGSYVGQQLSKPATETSEAIGLAAAVIILLFAFGTATAMMLPIVSAVIGLACALSIIRLLEHVLEVPGVAATLATMIGLGVGIDY